MTDLLINSLTQSSGSDISVGLSIFTMFLSLVFGGIIALTYYITKDEGTYQRSFAITLLMLPIILSVIILFVGSNIARAFSLAGTLSIIRFRSAPGDPKDIGYIFFDIAAGLSCGVGLYFYGSLFVVILCIVLIIIEKTKAFGKKAEMKLLKITIPEDLNYEGVFDNILEEYTKKYKLIRIKTTDLGSLFELEYNVVMTCGKNQQEFINKLRCRNGNLNITLTMLPSN
ncbi:MAG: DUF4956 domain-containing protein [Lachnospirales bacterium]